MNQRLAAAETALKAGHGAEAIEHITAAVAEDAAQTSQVYRALLVQFYRAGRSDEGADWAAKATARHPKDAPLWNMRGILLRQLKRYPEALAALDAATKLAPKDTGVMVNRGNILLDMGDASRAEAVFTKLVRMEPRVSEHQRQLGRALLKLGKRDQALLRFRQSVAMKKDNVEGWLDIVSVLIETHQAQLGEETVDRALAANPGDPKLLEAKAIVLRRSHQLRRAEAYLTELLPIYPDAAWLHYQLGGTISDFDRARGNVHMRRAVELNPKKADYLMALIESLERTRTGDEGGHIEEAYQLAKTALDLGVETFSSGHLKIIFEVFVRVCAFEDMDRLGDLRSLGRSWAESGKHTALLKLLAQVKTLDDRYELLEQHRIWGRATEASAIQRPIRKPAPRPPGGKIRLGGIL